MTSLAVIGGKWKPAILYFLQQHGVLRFGELRKVVPGITQKMLSQQLKELETDGIIVRRVYAEIPPRVEYRLSTLGESLRPMLDAMASWGMDYLRRG
ncbi:helix-turn-helix transcriptional regulator [Lewinella lacunae]|uniref:Helix-turn-helix transcriptional regulator n=2 Tax=Neolewinella lacunae TaxID=1517758 RepID=A0A923PK93_9BACT|nr:helix-turn-helix transcriptional regulator [Neolewinella lacunae]